MQRTIVVALDMSKAFDIVNISHTYKKSAANKQFTTISKFIIYYIINLIKNKIEKIRKMKIYKKQ